MKESVNTMIQDIPLKSDISSWMFYVLILLAVSIPLSEFGMSSAQFLLLGLWIFEGADYQTPRVHGHSTIRHFLGIIGDNLLGKFRMIYNNKVLLIILSFYVLHLVGLLYSTDTTYALKDLRIKLPLLSLPILLATSTKLDFKKFKILLIFFCLAVIAGTLVSMYVKLYTNISDPRQMSIFISHIRFSLLISLSIFILLYFLVSNTYKSFTIKALLFIAVCWLIVFLFILKSLTGIIITGLTILLLATIVILQYKKYTSALVVALVIFSLGSWYYVNDIFKDITHAREVNFSNLDKSTALGNPYRHDTISYGIESGSHVGIYLSVPELRDAWNKRSNLDYDGLDYRDQQLSYTLIRYLHSKGYRKDAAGINQLTSSEIRDIENGVANAHYLKSFDVRSQVEQVLYGYRTYMNHDNPNASSFIQRIEYWKTSLYLIKQKPLAGIGTGDLKNAFAKAYEDTNSKLEPMYRNRSHNQFFAIAIAFGLIGLFIFIVSLVWPPLLLGKFSNYFYLVFFIIAVISMLTEDTLETQAGVTFFAFFNSLLLFGINKEADQYSKLLSKDIKKP